MKTNGAKSTQNKDFDEIIFNYYNPIVNKAKTEYDKISVEAGVRLKSESGIDKFLQNTNRTLEEFKKFSRQKAIEAQTREFKTIQPKELLLNLTKSKITIQNFQGGIYYFTVDEIEYDPVLNKIKLIEHKYSKNSSLPISDIKDGLIKMILYSNISKLYINNSENILLDFEAVLKITTHKKLTDKDLATYTILLEEAKNNNFSILFEIKI
jgi:hypothetical protein